MNKLKQRIKKYESVSTRLACLSNEALRHLLHEATPVHEGIGGKSVLACIDKTPVFVKKIPITDRERLPQNVMSTANIFDLPLFYQYGVGSAGFGVWRELAAHIMTTNWVILAECVNFPLMYHWRILPSTPEDLNMDYWGNIDDYTQYWENSSAVRTRVQDINKASAYAAVFLEYVPQNLEHWLGNEIKQGEEQAERAIHFVEHRLKVTNHYMNTHGLVHFDAHFRNILTDGDTLFFTDFGLALSEKFELSIAEAAFLKQHRHYDEACAAVNLLHCIIISIFGKDQWEKKLHELIQSEPTQLTPILAACIKRYGSIALMMDDFFQKLQKDSKSTPYPASCINGLLTKNESRN
jgi:hypothetical protein